MRRVIVQEFVSLDGFAAGPKDSVDFVPASTRGDHSIGRQQLALMRRIDMMLLGRKTYEMFSGYWPKVTSGDERPFADKLNAMQKVVFSRTLDSAPWGEWEAARVVPTGPAKEVARLKAGRGRDMIVWGSISIAQELARRGLVDEYLLVVCPVTLGAGRGLFRDKVDPKTVRLRGVKAFDKGAAQLSYDVRRRKR